MDICLEEVHIESATYCNARCRMCPHSDMKRKGMMEFPLFKKIVDESKELGCENFTPWLINEPLIFPDLWKWMEYFREKKVKAIIFTNAGNLTEKIAGKLIEYSDVIHSITISFMGGTKEVYEANMGLNFDMTRDNIAGFLLFNHDIETHIFCIKDSFTKDTESEFLALWTGLPFASITMRVRHEWAGDRPDDYSLISQRRQANSVTRIPCSRILRQLDVFYDGSVPLCCVDWKGMARFGNVNEMSVKEIMENPLRQFYRDMHNEGFAGELPFCKDCDLTIG